MIGGILPDTIDARRTRLRHHAATPSDMAWLRVFPSLSGGPYRCDCRCRCHSTRALTATGAPSGSCGLEVSLTTLDCERGCRSAHILASECQMDETREPVGAHV